MRIDGFVGNTGIVGLNQKKANRDEVGGTGAEPLLDATEVYQQSGDVQGLLQTLQQIPLVRQEVVEEVANRLRAGELNSPKAKEETVQAVLEATLPNA